jgi:hypothetical protein
MIICHFDFICFAIAEPEHDPKLAINPDAMLPFQVALQSFEPIARRCFKVLQGFRSI